MNFNNKKLIARRLVSMKEHNLSLNYLHAFLILLVVAFHSIIAYEAYIPPITSPFTERPYIWAVFPILDSARSVAFTMFVVFCDHFFMPLLFFISGLFLWGSIERKGAIEFLKGRIIRLGVPFLIIKYLLIPLNYYPAYIVSGSEQGIIPFLKTWLILTHYPSGPVWFLSLLLLFDIIVLITYKFAPGWGRALGKKLAPVFERPIFFFLLLASLSTASLIFMSSFFGRYDWVNTKLLHFQTTRVLFYALYLLAGVAAGCYGLQSGLLNPEGRLSRRWPAWMAFTVVLYLILIVILARHLATPESLSLKHIYNILFGMFSASAGLFFTALFTRFTTKRILLMDMLHQNAYGMYLFHYFFVVWLQYAILDARLSALTKGIVVTAGAISLSWIFTSALNRAVPLARLILTPGDSIRSGNVFIAGMGKLTSDPQKEI